MKKKPANEDSDEFEADEPEEFDESGSDWAPEEEPANAKGKRKGKSKPTPKKATAGTKKKKVEKKPDPPSEEDEEDEEEEEEEEEDEEGEDSEESDSEAAGADANGGSRKLKSFDNGSFVVLKTDLKDGSNPPLWKIDGKALLQKFIPFEQDGKQLYKSTSTYSGWTQNNRDQYAAAPVTFVVQGKKETIIEFLRDQVNLDEKKEDAKEEKAKAKA